MNTLLFLPYGGIAVLVILLIIFEVNDMIGASRTSLKKGYEYYTQSGEALRICRVFAAKFKVYISGYYCPVPTKKDRRGEFFIVRASSPAEAEQRIDEIYRS